MSDVLEKFRHRFNADETRFGIARKPVHSLPVIDLGPFVDNGDEASRKEVGKQLREACINSGFFYVKNHGISQQDLTEALDWARKFFDLPLTEKEKLHEKLNPALHGWFPTDHENFHGVENSKADAKEGMNFGRELEPNDPMEGAPLMGPNFYPSNAVLPGYETFMRRYMTEYQRVAETLLQPFARSLGLEESYFDAMHEHPFTFTRMNYYPAVTEADLANQRWSCGVHTDYMGFTLLLQDDVGGLEIYNSAGEWVEVPYIPGTLVVNLGDMIAMWTNDLYASTPHRVRNVSGRKRYSIPYFYGPGRHAVVQCLEVCQGPGNPAKYPPTDVIRYNVEQTGMTHPEETLKSQRGFELPAMEDA